MGFSNGDSCCLAFELREVVDKHGETECLAKATGCLCETYIAVLANRVLVYLNDRRANQGGMEKVRRQLSFNCGFMSLGGSGASHALD
jgi:hypothetical protein